MIKLSPEQQRAYNRYITARDNVGLGSKKPRKWIPMRDCFACIDVAGLNHPLFVQNDAWLEYKEAFMAWLEVEPAFREQERMRMSRGDYGQQDSWEEKDKLPNDSYSKFKEEQQ